MLCDSNVRAFRGSVAGDTTTLVARHRHATLRPFDGHWVNHYDHLSFLDISRLHYGADKVKGFRVVLSGDLRGSHYGRTIGRRMNAQEPGSYIIKNY